MKAHNNETHTLTYFPILSRRDTHTLTYTPGHTMRWHTTHTFVMTHLNASTHDPFARTQTHKHNWKHTTTLKEKWSTNRHTQAPGCEFNTRRNKCIWMGRMFEHTHTHTLTGEREWEKDAFKYTNQFIQRSTIAHSSLTRTLSSPTPYTRNHTQESKTHTSVVEHSCHTMQWHTHALTHTHWLSLTGCRWCHNKEFLGRKSLTNMHHHQFPASQPKQTKAPLVSLKPKIRRGFSHKTSRTRTKFKANTPGVTLAKLEHVWRSQRWMSVSFFFCPSKKHLKVSFFFVCLFCFVVKNDVRQDEWIRKNYKKSLQSSKAHIVNPRPEP